jgi:hypothetical protein
MPLLVSPAISASSFCVILGLFLIAPSIFTTVFSTVFGLWKVTVKKLSNSNLIGGKPAFD